MSDTFGDRVRMALAVLGKDSPAQLGELCGTSRQTAGKWMKMREANLKGRHLFRLSRRLNVRIGWLVEGAGAMSWDVRAEAVLAILGRLSAKDAEKWLAAGRRLSGK